MGQRDIDKLYRDKLKGYSKEVDTDAIWSALDLEEKKKKSPFFVWLVGLFLLMFLSITYYASDKFDTQEKEQLPIDEPADFEDISEEIVLSPNATIIKNPEALTEINPSANQIQKSSIEKPNIVASGQYKSIAD